MGRPAPAGGAGITNGVATAGGLRRGVLAILLFGSIGVLIELLLIGHTEDWWQILPLALLGGVIVVATAALVCFQWRRAVDVARADVGLRRTRTAASPSGLVLTRPSSITLPLLSSTHIRLYRSLTSSPIVTLVIGQPPWASSPLRLKKRLQSRQATAFRRLAFSSHLELAPISTQQYATNLCYRTLARWADRLLQVAPGSRTALPRLAGFVVVCSRSSCSAASGCSSSCC